MLCTKRKIRKIIHEQNKVMGLANKVSIPVVNKVLLSFDIDLKKNNNKKVIVSNPCLFINKPNIQKEENHILITSGSNGAKEINDLAIKIINNNIIFFIITSYYIIIYYFFISFKKQKKSYFLTLFLGLLTKLITVKPMYWKNTIINVTTYIIWGYHMYDIIQTCNKQCINPCW